MHRTIPSWFRSRYQFRAITGATKRRDASDTKHEQE